MSFDPFNAQVLRIKVAAVEPAQAGARTMLQYTGLDEDARDQVELLLPPGYVAAPIAGSDALEIQVGAAASHKVVLGGDHPVDALADLQQGESGLSRGGQQIMLRVSGTELISAPLKWGPSRTALKRLVQEEFVALYNAHIHPCPGGDTGPPTVAMTAAQLTGGS